MFLKWKVQTLYNMHINFYDIWNSNTILFRWFKLQGSGEPPVVPPYVTRHHHFTAPMHVARPKGSNLQIIFLKCYFYLKKNGLEKKRYVPRTPSRASGRVAQSSCFPSPPPSADSFFSFPRAAPILSTATAPPSAPPPSSRPQPYPRAAPSAPPPHPIDAARELLPLLDPLVPINPTRRPRQLHRNPTSCAAPSPSTQPARRPTDVVLRLLPSMSSCASSPSTSSCASTTRRRPAPRASTNHRRTAPPPHRRRSAQPDASPFCAAGIH
jgi:hypothetical protein